MKNPFWVIFEPIQKLRKIFPPPYISNFFMKSSLFVSGATLLYYSFPHIEKACRFRRDETANLFKKSAIFLPDKVSLRLFGVANVLTGNLYLKTDHRIGFYICDNLITRKKMHQLIFENPRILHQINVGIIPPEFLKLFSEPFQIRMAFKIQTIRKMQSDHLFSYWKNAMQTKIESMPEGSEKAEAIHQVDSFFQICSTIFPHKHQPLNINFLPGWRISFDYSGTLFGLIESKFICQTIFEACFGNKPYSKEFKQQFCKEAAKYLHSTILNSHASRVST
eukprot:Sdes_comp20308_c0_seq2m13933